MENMKIDNIRIFLKKHKFGLLTTAITVCVVIVMISSPKTVASGNGYKHQIGDFGECDFHFDGCTKAATHRMHHFFGNDNYCDSCWDRYGEDMFIRLSGKDDAGLDYNQNKCRYSGCGKTAKYSDWDRRYCAEHLQGKKYCRYPGCSEQIPINGFDDYCSKH